MAASAGDVLVGLTLRPARPGPNTAWLSILPIGGEQAASGLHVAVTAAGRAAPVRRCGPACRAADVDLLGGETLSAAVGPGGGSATFHVPALPAPDARGLVDGAVRRMHELRAFRLDETLQPARPPLSVAYAFQAPDRLSYRVSGGAETVIVGPTEYSRDGPSAPWRSQVLPPVQVPSFVWDGAAIVTPRALGSLDEDGRTLQLTSFYESQDGVPVWFELAVDGQGLVERAAMRAQAHFMTHRYHDFDAPLTIEPPPPA
jgi:copper transport protein